MVAVVGARGERRAVAVLGEQPGQLPGGVFMIAAARSHRDRRPVAVDGLPLRRHQLIVVGAIEAAAHGWDAGHGAGRGRPIPDDLAARLLAELPLVIDRNTRRGAFADPIPLPPDRAVGERLLGALGRDPRARGTRRRGPRPAPGPR